MAAIKKDHNNKQPGLPSAFKSSWRIPQRSNHSKLRESLNAKITKLFSRIGELSLKKSTSSQDVKKMTLEEMFPERKEELPSEVVEPFSSEIEELSAETEEMFSEIAIPSQEDEQLSPVMIEEKSQEGDHLCKERSSATTPQRSTSQREQRKLCPNTPRDGASKYSFLLDQGIQLTDAAKELSDEKMDSLWEDIFKPLDFYSILHEKSKQFSFSKIETNTFSEFIKMAAIKKDHNNKQPGLPSAFKSSWRIPQRSNHHKLRESLNAKITKLFSRIGELSLKKSISSQDVKKMTIEEMFPERKEELPSEVVEPFSSEIEELSAETEEMSSEIAIPSQEDEQLSPVMIEEKSQEGDHFCKERSSATTPQRSTSQGEQRKLCPNTPRDGASKYSFLLDQGIQLTDAAKELSDEKMDSLWEDIFKPLDFYSILHEKRKQFSSSKMESMETNTFSEFIVNLNQY
ncbi:hypothetical protein ACROYT_G024028 [Oculina patagonica]